LGLQSDNPRRADPPAGWHQTLDTGLLPTHTQFFVFRYDIQPQSHVFRDRVGR